jgi:hypothetical protein
VEHEHPLQCSQQLLADPYPELDESYTHPPPISIKTILIFTIYPRLGLLGGLFPAGVPIKTQHFITTSPHVLHALYVILINLITPIIFGE